jgi:hypothetical protein
MRKFTLPIFWFVGLSLFQSLSVRADEPAWQKYNEQLRSDMNKQWVQNSQDLRDLDRSIAQGQQDRANAYQGSQGGGSNNAGAGAGGGDNSGAAERLASSLRMSGAVRKGNKLAQWKDQLGEQEIYDAAYKAWKKKYDPALRSVQRKAKMPKPRRFASRPSKTGARRRTKTPGTCAPWPVSGTAWLSAMTMGCAVQPLTKRASSSVFMRTFANRPMPL